MGAHEELLDRIADDIEHQRRELEASRDHEQAMADQDVTHAVQVWVTAIQDAGSDRELESIRRRMTSYAEAFQALGRVAVLARERFALKTGA